VASPFSGLVLVAGAALSSPTLYGAFIVGTVPIEEALLRLVVVVAVTTVAVTLVQWLFDGTSPMSETQLETARRLAELGSKGDATGDAGTAGQPDRAAGTTAD
jgi:hypothetical protein